MEEVTNTRSNHTNLVNIGGTMGNEFIMSKDITNISAALNDAQRNIGSASRDTANSFYNSKYADLNAVLAACKNELNSANITILQPVTIEGDYNYVSTILLHTSGQYIGSKMRLILKKDDMQQLGSAVSYARRYTLQSLVAIPSSEDDDGNLASGKKDKPTSKVANKPQKFKREKLVSKPEGGSHDI